MSLSGLHLLLTYLCTSECDHCFVWGGPSQTGTMTMADVENILDQAQELGSIRSIYFEGGEPFLFYPVFLAGVRKAAELGFEVGVVTNAYWSNDIFDAIENLRPLAGLVQDLSVSSDLFHYDEMHSLQAKNAEAAATQLGIPLGMISIAQPDKEDAPARVGQLPLGESAVRFRGRAASTLAPSAPKHPWDGFTTCPYEELRDPGRVHVDPLGNLHICQGILMGNMFESKLTEISVGFDPEHDPIIGPLLRGGPAELVREHGVEHEQEYADACHLCYEARTALRPDFPDLLGPDQVYGVLS